MDRTRRGGGQSLSKFVQQCVEYAIEQGGPDFTELGERSKKIQNLEQEVTELRKEVNHHDVVLNLSSGTLRFPTESDEARTCMNELEGKEGYQVKIFLPPAPVNHCSLRLNKLSGYRPVLPACAGSNVTLVSVER